MRIVGACDPSLGRGGGGDYTAIVTIACHTRTKECYVLHTDIRRLRPDEILDAILESHRIWGYSSFGVEFVQFQQMLKDELEKRARARGQYLYVREVRPTGDKVARVQAILPLMTSGTLKFSWRQTMLLEQMKRFPGGHDDSPDALEMAVKMAQTGECRWVAFEGGVVP